MQHAEHCGWLEQPLVQRGRQQVPGEAEPRAGPGSDISQHPIGEHLPEGVHSAERQQHVHQHSRYNEGPTAPVLVALHHDVLQRPHMCGHHQLCVADRLTVGGWLLLLSRKAILVSACSRLLRSRC